MTFEISGIEMAITDEREGYSLAMSRSVIAQSGCGTSTCTCTCSCC